MDDWIEYSPAGGWASFARSEALTDALWGRLPADDWHYLNFVVGSSVWESRRDASMVSAHSEGKRVVHLAAQGGAARAVVSHLAVEFGLVVVVTSEAEQDVAGDRGPQSS
ncbi:hypothetical protein [Zavarzinella formosa]|uniref:hypothetical protein n=1 Tax=Zavarzinella formosa TaxID=360055 RepID=UPI00035D8A4C|nr:hypothetical protein [Zavarzinella formosa]